MYQPAGIKWYDANHCKELMLCMERNFCGWILYRHPDGGWVSLREARDKDYRKIGSALIEHAEIERLRKRVKTLESMSTSESVRLSELLIKERQRIEELEKSLWQIQHRPL